MALCDSKNEIVPSKVTIENEQSDISPCYIYERCISHEGPQSDKPDDEKLDASKRVFPSRRYSDFESNLKNFTIEIKRPSDDGNLENSVSVIPAKSRRSMSMFGSIIGTRNDKCEKENYLGNGVM